MRRSGRAKQTGKLLRGNIVTRHVDQGHLEQDLGVAGALRSHVKTVQDLSLELGAV